MPAMKQVTFTETCNQAKICFNFAESGETIHLPVNMRTFFDSSAFAKCYFPQEGTEAVVQWCDHATEITLSRITLPALISALL